MVTTLTLNSREVACVILSRYFGKDSCSCSFGELLLLGGEITGNSAFEFFLSKEVLFDWDWLLDCSHPIAEHNKALLFMREKQSPYPIAFGDWNTERRALLISSALRVLSTWER